MTHKKETKRDVEISLQRSNQDNKNVSFRVRLDTGRTITLTMSPYYFALMVTGMSDVPAEMTLRNVEVVVAPRSTAQDKEVAHAEALRNAALGGG